MTVAALYIDNLGPYPELLGASNCWGAERDARFYVGPGPLVAHPPCGPWGRLRHMYRGNEHNLAPLAVAQVQSAGGVLEHPAHSGLWEKCGLPYPDDGLGPDEFGGFTLQVDQCDWGHVARKKTWLYIVNKSSRDMFKLTQAEAWLRERSGKPTHYVSGFTGDRRGAVPAGVKICSAEQRRRTPKRFARWLISIAERCVSELDPDKLCPECLWRPSGGHKRDCSYWRREPAYIDPGPRTVQGGSDGE